MIIIEKEYYAPTGKYMAKLKNTSDSKCEVVIKKNGTPIETATIGANMTHLTGPHFSDYDKITVDIL